MSSSSLFPIPSASRVSSNADDSVISISTVMLIYSWVPCSFETQIIILTSKNVTLVDIISGICKFQYVKQLSSPVAAWFRSRPCLDHVFDRVDVGVCKGALQTLSSFLPRMFISCSPIGFSAQTLIWKISFLHDLGFEFVTDDWWDAEAMDLSS